MDNASKVALLVESYMLSFAAPAASWCFGLLLIEFELQEVMIGRSLPVRTSEYHRKKRIGLLLSFSL